MIIRVNIVLIVLILSILFTLSCTENNSHYIEYLPSTQIPKEILKQCTGSIVDTVIWKDRNGTFVFFACEREKGRIGVNLISELFVNLFQINGSITRLWKIYDFADDGLTSVGFIKDSRKVIDIDNDGTNETIFMYAICSDGLEPIKIKLMLHNHYQKYAIRGEIPKDENYLDTYRKNIDPNFYKCDKRILTFALEYWDKHIRLYAKDFLSDTLIDSMLNLYSSSIKRKSQESPPKKK